MQNIINEHLVKKLSACDKDTSFYRSLPGVKTGNGKEIIIGKRLIIIYIIRISSPQVISDMLGIKSLI